MPEGLKEFAEERLQLTGRTPFEAARIGGLEQNFIHDILRGRKLAVHGRNIDKLALALGATPEAVLAAIRGGTPMPGAVRTPGRRRAVSEVVRANVDIPDFQSLPRDLPVYGTASGSIMPKLGESFTLDTQRIVAQVRRPPSLTGVPGAYALYVAGESMIPEHKPGDLRVANPNKPPRGGDTVVIRVRLGEGLPEQAFIKTYIGRTPDSVIASQLNPKATARFKASTVVSVDRVLTTAELLEA